MRPRLWGDHGGLAGLVIAAVLLGLFVSMGGLVAAEDIAENPTADAQGAIVPDDLGMVDSTEWLESPGKLTGDAATFEIGEFAPVEEAYPVDEIDSSMAFSGHLASFSATQSTNEDWSTTYGHKANANAVTVVDGVLYVVSDERDASTIHAIDADTGHTRWSEPLDSTQQLGGHAPTVVDGTVYVGSHWRLHAFDASTGERKWDEYAGTIATSPTVYEDHVLVGIRGGALRSFDTGNGSQAWSYSLEDDWASVDSWALSEHSSVTIVDGIAYTTTKTEIQALELTDPAIEPDEPEWTWVTPNEGNRDDQITGGLTVLEGSVFVHLNTYEGVHMIGGEARPTYSSNLVALDADEGTEDWIFEVDHPGTRGTSSPTAVSDEGDAVVYLHGNDNTLYAIDGADGSVEWQLANLHSSIATSSPTVTEDRVYVGSATFDGSGNGIFSVDWSTGFSTGFHSTGDDRVTASPIVVDGNLYVTGSRLVPPTYGDVATLYAFDVAEDGSSIDSRVLQATLNHHDFWTGAQRGGVAITDVSLKEEAILQNEDMAVNATFRNFGSTSVEHKVTLQIGDYGMVTETIQIDEYDETQDILEAEVTEAGTYAVSVDGVNAGTLHVVDPAEPVYMAEADLVDDVVWVERDIEVEATFTNIGSSDVTIEANVTADGTEITTESIAIDADDSETIILSGQVSDPGEYDIAIDGTPIGTVEVLADPTYLVDGSVVNERILVDETVDVELELRNLAAHEETHKATLAVDEVASTETSVTLDGEETRTEEVSLTVDQTGSYNVTYGNDTIGGVEVLAEAVHLLDAELVDRDPPIALPEERVEVRLLYENVANSEREYDITINADDDAVAETTVDLAAHDRKFVSINVTDLDEGVYDVAANDEMIETLYVGNYDHFILENDSIQAVLDNATSNDRLGVAGGTYNESLTIDVDGISISNFAGEEPILDGERVMSRAITVEAADAHIEGFTIIRFVADGNIDGAVYVDADASDFEFRNNNMTDNRDALFLRGGEGSVISNNSITANDGTAIESVSNAEITVTGNTIRENAGHGIVDDGHNPDHWLINENTIVNNTGGGISGDFMDSEISHNLVTDSDEGGIRASSRTNITDNTLLRNQDGQFGARTGGIDSGVDAVVENNTVSDVAGTGIEPSGRTLVRNNTVTDAGTIGIEIGFSDVQVTENTLSGHEADLRITSGPGTIDNATVTNNTFETGIELHAVDEGLVEAPHTMENNSVGGAPLYYAANTDAPDIDPDAGQIILVNVTNAHISGFVFENVVAGIQLSHVNDSVVSDNEIRNVETRFLHDTGVLGVWHSMSTEIVNNTIEDVDRSGIHIVDSTELTVAQNIITDTDEVGIRIAGFWSDQNTIEGNLITGASIGIDASGNDDGAVIDNHLANTVFGIEHGGDRAEVAHNTVEGSETLGISVSGDEIVVSQNTVTGSEGDGISVSGREGTTVSWNTVSGSDGLGMTVEVDDAGSTVEKNIVRLNDDGMYLSGHGGTDLVNTDVVNNTIEDNIELGIQVDGDQGVLVTNNSIAGNGDGLLYTGGVQYLNATNNWWGAPDGPSGDVSDPETGAIANGTGDSIATGVGGDWILFDPWLDVAPADPSPLAVYANDDDVIDTEGLRDAVSHWRAGDIDTDLLRDVVSYWRSGQSIA